MAHNQNNQPRRNIDGFFRQSEPRPKFNGRPGIDSMRGRQEHARAPRPNRQQNYHADWQPRHVHPTSEPRSQRMSDFFHNFPSEKESGGSGHHNTPAHASAAGTAMPRPLSGRGEREQDGHSGWRKYLPKPSKTWAKRGGLLALAVLLIIGGYLFVKFLIAGSQIFQGNVFNAIFAQGKELETDEHGNTNILLFGTSEDDPNHPGALLTDSMMLVSVDQETKQAFMVSIPRDLYVDYGTSCSAGYEGKINNVYVCAKRNNDGSEKAAQRALRQKVGEVFGMDVQYSAHVNYTALKKVVNAVGGITVTIDSPDPRGVLDRNFDWQCNYECYLVKHPNGPVKLDGKHALALARARGSTPPTYGFSGGNFSREMYQRKILLAIKEKAVSAGVLANPIRVNNLIEAVGDNVRTNFKTSEIATLVDLARTVKPNEIRTVSLVDEQRPLVTTGNIGGASIVQPVAGLYEYNQIQAAMDAYAAGNTAYFEFADVAVLNASERAGAAGDKADKLSEAGIDVANVGNAPSSLDTAPVTLYNLSGGENPKTRQKLEKLLGVEAVRQTPAGIASDADFVIIIGSNGSS